MTVFEEEKGLQKNVNFDICLQVGRRYNVSLQYDSAKFVFGGKWVEEVILCGMCPVIR